MGSSELGSNLVTVRNTWSCVCSGPAPLTAAGVYSPSAAPGPTSWCCAPLRLWLHCDLALVPPESTAVCSPRSLSTAALAPALPLSSACPAKAHPGVSVKWSHCPQLFRIFLNTSSPPPCFWGRCWWKSFTPGFMKWLEFYLDLVHFEPFWSLFIELLGH